MKVTKIIIWCLLAVLATGCASDDLGPQSIFTSEPTDSTEFDKWLKANYTDPYNISFLYRYNDKETDNTYNVIPADVDKSKALAIMIKHVWIESYNELVGQDFLKTNSPRVYQLIGSAEYDTNGSEVLGVAEGGVKVTLFRVNNIDIDNPVIDSDSPFPDTEAVPIDLNYWFFHTMHHEFCHILTQKTNYSTEFQTISAGKYKATDWVNLDDADAPAYGFVSGYASEEYNEDFAEIYATYVTHTEEAWNKILAAGVTVKKDDDGNPLYNLDKDGNKQYQYDTTGRDAIVSKLAIVKDYFKNQWGIDLDKLRDIVLRRSQEVSTLDLRTLK